MTARLLAAISSVVIVSGHGQAQPVGDSAEGRRLAAGWCSQCHQTAPVTPGPVTDAVPSFAAIAQLPSTTALSLRAFLQTPHPVMPNFNLTQRQIDDIGQYILSLRTPGPR